MKIGKTRKVISKTWTKIEGVPLAGGAAADVDRLPPANPGREKPGGLAGSFPLQKAGTGAEGIRHKGCRAVWRKRPPKRGFRRVSGPKGAAGAPLVCLVLPWRNWCGFERETGFPVEP